MAKFGKFASFEEFISSYEAAQRAKEEAALKGLSFAARRVNAKRPKHRNVVEVEAMIAQRFPDDEVKPKHHHLHIEVTKLIESDEHVDRDVNRVLQEKDHVFVAIRYGDRMGIPKAVPGLEQGALITIQGEWITRDDAYEHDGERLSVLHFTHHNLGFVSLNGEIYQ